MKLKVQSLKRLAQYDMDNSNYQFVMLAKLEDFDEVRLVVLDHLLTHKNKVKKVYNKHVQSKKFSVGNLVWNVILLIIHKDPKFSKWSLNQDGPYVISKVLIKDYYHLANQDEEMQFLMIIG